MINLIWAMDENRLVGKGNKLPWRYSKDLKYFKEMTHGKTVLMGDATYESLKGYYKNRPLPFGKIYVANLESKYYPDATRVPDLFKFLDEFEDDLWVVGGKTIYELSLPYADRLYITYILNRHEGDVYFKPFSLKNFKVIKKRVEPSLLFTVYERR